MHNLLNPEFWLSVFVLTLLEIVLNADNLIFIVAASSRLEPKKQALARKLGMIGAAIMRLIFLSLLFFALSFTQPLFSFHHFVVTLNNLILIFGGIFLIINPGIEIYALRQANTKEKKHSRYTRFSTVLIQIILLDIVFSIDNVVTAIGVAKIYSAMVIAILLAMTIIVLASNMLSKAVDKHPKLKVLGLGYLILIGVVLVMRGFHEEISSMYLYAALGFVIFSQLLLVYTHTE